MVRTRMAQVFHRSFFLNGPAGQLEAMLWTAPESGASTEPPPSAIVCHPHPMFGGTMHNKVVYQAAKALHELGIPVLRFNFRGTGLSEGAHDRGRGEQDDVRTGLSFLATEFPDRPIILAGFSFGAWVGLRVGCEDARVTSLIGLGLPVDRSDLSLSAHVREAQANCPGWKRRIRLAFESRSALCRAAAAEKARGRRRG